MKSKRKARSRLSPAGFSLLELIVIVALVALLGALLFPVSRFITERGQSAGCLSHLRQLHMAVCNMAADDGGYLPLAQDTKNNSASWSWYLTDRGYLPPFIEGQPHPLLDPASKAKVTGSIRGNYGINRNLVGSGSVERVTLASVVKPTEKFLLFCSGIYSITRLQAANPSLPHLYLPGRTANQAINWPADLRDDAVEGRHGKRIHTISVSGNVEVWEADVLPVTPARWDRLSE